MYSVIQSPCVFEPLPMVNVFDGRSLGYGPEPKRRRALVGNRRCLASSPCHPEPLPKKSLASLRYTVEDTQDAYILSLFKKVPRGALEGKINEELVSLKEEAYRPVYHIVHDIFGNPYYLEEERDEEALLRKALSQLDMKKVSRRVAKELFQDHEIELNQRGDELTISSQIDGISKSFDIGQQVNDVNVLACKLDESNENAVLKLILEKKSRKCGFEKLPKWPQITLQNVPEQKSCIKESKSKDDYRERSLNEEKIEAEARAELEKQIVEEERQKAAARAAQEQRRKVEARVVEEQRQKAMARAVEEEMRKLEARKVEEERRRAAVRAAEEERKKVEARIAEEERQKAALRAAEEKKKLELERKAAKEKKNKQKKAALIAEKKAKRLQKQQKSVSRSNSPNAITININFGDDARNGNIDNKGFTAPLKRHPSPILEDVDDEEIDRFHESLTRSPRGSSIIEDV